MITRKLKYLIDFLAFALAVSAAFWLRFDLRFVIIFQVYSRMIAMATLIDLALGTGFLLYYRPYLNIWRYTSFKELWDIAKIIFWQKVLFAFLVRFFLPVGFPRSVFIIAPLVTFALMVVPRFITRFYLEGKLRSAKNTGKRTLIVGAGDAGEKICREIISHAELGYQLVGFVDDDPRKLRSYLHGYQVLGRIQDLGSFIKKYRAETVIVALPSAGRKLIRRIYELLESYPVETLVLPGLYELIGRKISLSALRPFDIKDLLLRDSVVADVKKIREAFQEVKVMVTGACGSIGEEITRQLAVNGAHLVILDNNETGIFDLAADLAEVSDLAPYVGDIRYRFQLARIIEKEKPDYLFHAAAYKHVPLMESHPEEAFLTNVVGTLNVLEAAAGRVGRIICVSTDKAVEPENVMGMTKKMGEILVQAFARQYPSSRICAVRFGNVLGSRGNVLEIWKHQLEKGESLTITDPAMKRYFMTTPEAVTLVLEAGLMDGSGNIFVLKMGNLIPIKELARVFCELQGYTLEKDVELEIVGRRPGEKRIEKLWGNGEEVVDTAHTQIMRVSSDHQPLSYDELTSFVREMEKRIVNGENVAIKEELRGFVERP